VQILFFGKQNSLQEIRWKSKTIFGGIGVAHNQWVFPLSTCDNIWMHGLVLKFDLNLVFPYWRTLFEEIIFTMVAWCLDLQLSLDATPIAMTTFEMWMNRGQHDIFAYRKNVICILEVSTHYSRPFWSQWYYWAWVGKVIEACAWKIWFHL
jgi:hypothetical protein